MAYTPEQRQAVRRSYVHDRVSLAGAASRHHVPYQTVRRWKSDDRENGDCWDRARQASRMAAGSLGDLTTTILEDFTRLFGSTIKALEEGDADPIERAEAIARLADAYGKTMKTAGQADPKVAKLSIAMQVIEELAKFIRERQPELLPSFSALLEPFGARIAEVLG